MRSVIAIIILSLFLAECFGHSVDPRKLKPDGRIVGGSRAAIQHHPYQLTLQRWNSHSCGASIISRKWAVTAGHCVGSDPYTYQLGAGSPNRLNATLFNVTRIVRHPQYDSAAIDYDIALIQIETEFPYGDNVRPIKLPERELRNGEVVNITGWGALSQGGSISNLLMKVTVPIVERDTCTKAYQSVKAVTERMICAGELESGGKDSCQGDSGGPLSANSTLYGIVSWGYGCARPNYPGVYTNVAYLRHWITSVTGV